MKFEFICLIIQFAYAFICAVIVFCKTSSLKKSIKYLEENMPKYKTYDSAVAAESKKVSFSESIPDYVLDSSSNELHRLSQDKNVQVKIQSYIDSCLERALERFLCAEPEEDAEELRVAYGRHVEDLAAIGAAMEAAEDYREQLGLPDSASYADIYAAVDKQAHDIKSRLERLNKSEEPKPEEDKK